MKSSDDVTRHSFSDSGGEDAPVTNRSYKAALFGSSNQATPSSSQGLTSGLQDPNGKLSSPLSFAAISPSFETASVPEAPITPAAEALKSFYSALAALSSGKRREPITILHLGDDHIADDRFTGEMRAHFQSRFGNAGRGMTMPGLFNIRGIKAERGGKWTVSNSASGAPGVYGITGVQVSAASNDAWVRLTSSQGSVDWVEVTFATGPSQGTAVVIIDGEAKLVPTTTNAIDQTSIRISAKAREIVIKPKGDAGITLLSVATGTENAGVRYINLGLPGATAATPGKWNADLVAKDVQKLNPDLVIFNYGTREGFIDNLDLSQYEMRLKFLIEQFRQLSPQASFLVIGPPDAARLPRFAGASASLVCRALNPQELANYDQLMRREDVRLGRWHAPPRLDAVRSAQRRVAASTGAYYWDWAQFMGGACSIHTWSTSNPPLAASDRVTLTGPGAERSARGFFADLMNGYDAYQRSIQAAARPPIQTAATSASPSPKSARKPKR